MSKILIIEDERQTADTIALYLGKEGHECKTAYDGPSGVRLIMQDSFDLLVLDWMLPGLDGLEVCKIAKSTQNLKVLMVTARASVMDKVTGLDTGADDYMTKPFGLREMNARIRTLLRRWQYEVPESSDGTAHVLRMNVKGIDLRVDLDAYTATARGKPILLTTVELRLLYLLAARKGGLVGRQDIMDEIYGMEGTDDFHVLTVHISNLRRKLKGATGQDIIKSVYGVGYRLDGMAKFPHATDDHIP